MSRSDWAWRPDVWNQKSADPCSHWGSWAEFFLCLFQLLVAVSTSRWVGQLITVPVSGVTWFPPLLSVSTCLSLLPDCWHLLDLAQLEDLRWTSQDLPLMSIRTLFPKDNTHMFWGLGFGMCFGRPPFNPLYLESSWWITKKKALNWFGK